MKIAGADELELLLLGSLNTTSVMPNMVLVELIQDPFPCTVSKKMPICTVPAGTAIVAHLYIHTRQMLTSRIVLSNLFCLYLTSYIIYVTFKLKLTIS